MQFALSVTQIEAHKMAKKKKAKSRTPQANKAIRDEMQFMETSGYPTPQATAIAFRKYRDNELNIGAVPKLNKANNAARKDMNAIRAEGQQAYNAARRMGITGNLSTIRRLKSFMKKEGTFRGFRNETKKK